MNSRRAKTSPRTIIHPWRYFATLLAGLLIVAACNNSRADEADRLINEFAEVNKLVGVQAAVAADGRIVWSHGVGFADLEQGVRVDPATTLMRIGSVSKSLTAVGLGKLIEMGKIDLDATVQQYVHEFPEKRWPITTRQLGGHLAGIRHYRDNEMLSSIPYPTVMEGLAIFQDDTLEFQPGSQYSYSSYGWNLISAVMEGASGEPFLDFMQMSVINPLGLEHTAADWLPEIIPGRGRYYSQDSLGAIHNAPIVDNSYKWAGGGYLSTAEDLVNFGLGMLGERAITSTTWDLLTESQITSGGDTTHYGIGWKGNTDEKNRRWVGHTGGSVGGVTRFIIYPEEEVVVAVIVNMSSAPFGTLTSDLAQVFTQP